ncbi:hypothetical protein CK203_055463 [Vitis vinifera]|uniref:Uncharacterized protein n=1 Tax=Vitis vinifera TaxID=29760 RepID=A0A438GJG1_VITVI|nr:hypothetical protein CK203_055463 [Vitis vinifera]
MLMAHNAKHKLGFVDGSISQPPLDDPFVGVWPRCNNIVTSWLLKFVSKEIIVVYFTLTMLKLFGQIYIIGFIKATPHIFFRSSNNCMGILWTIATSYMGTHLGPHLELDDWEGDCVLSRPVHLTTKSTSFRAQPTLGLSSVDPIHAPSSVQSISRPHRIGNKAGLGRVTPTPFPS